jgi:hypothetical protein
MIGIMGNVLTQTEQRPISIGDEKMSCRRELNKFFLIVFYLQAVQIHSVNGEKLLEA